MTLHIFSKIKSYFSCRCKPKYFLDENIRYNNVKQAKHLFVEFKELAFMGTPDEKIFEIATKKNLVIVTRDVKFALGILTKKQDVIFETELGHRYFIQGKNSKLIDHNKNPNQIRLRSRKHKRLLEMFNKIPFFLPLDGYYLVSGI